MEKLYLSKIRKENWLNTNRTDRIREWLDEHNIKIYYDGNKSYVNGMEFQFVYESPMIIELKRKYENWNQVYLLQTNNDIEGFVKYKIINRQASFSEKYISRTK